MCRFDVDKSGAIDLKEMVKVMKSIYVMIGDNYKTRDALEEMVFDYIWFDYLLCIFIIF